MYVAFYGCFTGEAGKGSEQAFRTCRVPVQHVLDACSLPSNLLRALAGDRVVDGEQDGEDDQADNGVKHIVDQEAGKYIA